MKNEKDPVCYVKVPVHACMQDPEPGDKEGKRSVGHFHVILVSGVISNDKGEQLGEVGVDPGCTLVLTVNGKKYHIKAQPVWEALQAQLGFPEKVQQ